MISQRRFIILTETFPALLVTFQTPIVTIIHRMGHCCVEAGLHSDPAGDGMLTQGHGTWSLGHLQRTDGVKTHGHQQMDL